MEDGFIPIKEFPPPGRPYGATAYLQCGTQVKKKYWAIYIVHHFNMFKPNNSFLIKKA
jgi:hypothetical protein